MASASDPSRWTVRRRACAVVDAELQGLNEPPYHHDHGEIISGQHMGRNIVNFEDQTLNDHDLDLDIHDDPDSEPEQALQDHDQIGSPLHVAPSTESESGNLFQSSESDHDDVELHVEAAAGFNQEEFEIQVDDIIDGNEDFDSESDENDSQTLEDRLCHWANEFQHDVSHAAIAGLLTALRPDFPNLPKDPRTLLSTDVKKSVMKLAGGEYHHFGLKECILAELSLCNVHAEMLPQVMIDINIDGLPIFKSSSGQVWPILGLIKSLPVKNPFVIGIYYGNSKPCDVHEYLSFFIEDVCSLRETGVNYSGINIPVDISAFICDAPARAFIKQIKGHSGYYSCERCTQRGEYTHSKVTFPSTDSPLRTDDLFSELAYEHHQTAQSPLLNIPVNLVSQFPLDYMHLICLGVTRRLIMLWKKGSLRCRIGGRAINEVSERLLSLKGFIPREFARKPRSLIEVDRWKATEYRLFLLYTGPVVLSKVLPDEMYKNFLLLSAAVHILLSPSLCKPALIQHAEVLLINFVQHFQGLYGQENVVYNVHSLIHLPQDALRYGPLDNVSAFPFENHLGKIKKMVRKPSQPLQQIVRRISEKEHSNVRQKSQKKIERLKGQHRNGPVPHELLGSCQYRELNCEVGCIRNSHGDNCVNVRGQVAIVKNIVVHDGTEYVVYTRFRTCNNFFTYPLPSQEIGIRRVCDLHWEVEFAPASEIRGKCVLLPLPVADGNTNRRTGMFMSAALLHTL